MSESPYIVRVSQGVRECVLGGRWLLSERETLIAARPPVPRPPGSRGPEPRKHLTGNGVCWITAAEKALIEEWIKG